jgi:RHS repeat-associated protein
VDDFSGAAHLSYPIVVPPGRSGLSPQLSLNYSSTGVNGWLGVGWDIPVGSIQRRGPRKGVPKYNDTNDVFELNLGGASQELVPIGGDEYRLKIEGALLKVKYYSTGNYWELWDKSGIKMSFGSTVNSRIGKVRDPNNKNDIFRWCLDRVDDPKTNYMELIYFRDQDATNTYQIYLQEIKYNAQVSGGLPHNHRVLFNLEASNRPDPFYHYRGGFKMLTTKRLSSIEVKTNNNLIRKYQFQYANPNSKSVLSSITLYGNDGVSTLPPTNFFYQAHSPGFLGGTTWSNPSVFSPEDSINGNFIRNTSTAGYGTFTDVIDMNGDGLPDRVVYDKTSPYDTWTLYSNNTISFGSGVGWPNPSVFSPGDSINGNYIQNTSTIGAGPYTDVIDMNGDGLADRVVYDKEAPYDTWTLYLNTGSGFGSGADWPNPSAWDSINGNYIRNSSGYGTYTDVIDMNGDGLPDRVVYNKNCTYPYTNCPWTVYFNTGSGFGPGVEWPNPSVWDAINGNFIRNTNAYGAYTDLIDMNGDGLPDRVVYNKNCSYPYTNCPWTVYFNNGNGFDAGVSWPNPSAWDWINGNYIRNTGTTGCGPYTDVIDMNGDGLPDRVVYDKTSPYDTWTVYFNNGSGFGPGVDWLNPSAGLWGYTDWINGNFIRNTSAYGTYTDVFDIDGDGLPDRVVYDKTSPYTEWNVYYNKGPVSDLLSKVDNGIGGTIEITYVPSTDYANTFLPFVVQTVSSYTQKDGKGNSYLYKYAYSGGFYDSTEVEFRGFRQVTAFQMFDTQSYESKTDTWFHQDYYRKGKIETQILTSKEGHTRQVDNVWYVQDNGNGTRFPRLDQTTSSITDAGYLSYTHRSTYLYDQYFNVAEEHKYGATSDDEIHTYFSYTNFTDKWILSKPTDINVKNSSQNIVSRKWMDYDSNTGNALTEEVCKSDTPNTGCASRNSIQNPVITYQYYTDGNLWRITDPRNYTTTINYDSTKTHVYETTNYLNHKTTTVYDPGTGNLTQLIPPHLQGTAYSFTNTYDVFGRKTHEDRPDGGWTSYQYLNFGNPDTQYVEKREHIIGGPSVLDHYTFDLFDGMGRTYWLESTGPDGKRIITQTQFDQLGRVWKKSNPYFYGIDTPYLTTITYDGLSRVIDVLTPDNYHITTAYQGLKKVVTDPRGYSTAYTYDVYQRLKKVEDPYGTLTEYNYDTLGNLIQLIAAKWNTEQNTTTMTYDSLSKKRSMTDPDMGYWTYNYDKSGNLTSQTDAKSQTITFNYDGLNRPIQKTYQTNPIQTITYTYDDPAIPYSKGKLTKVSDPSGGETKEDSVLEYDLMQRIKKSKKKIGADEVTFEKSYDSLGRVLSIKYLAGTPNEKTYSYEYDVAGDLLYVKDNATGNHLVDYSDFTALGQQKIATFPKPNNVSVKTTYTYDPPTARLKTLITQKLVGGSPTDTYQNLDYQQFDGKGNITNIYDSLNGITHSYTYDSLDRLLTASGAGNNPYTQNYQYDRIGNITYKSDVGNYSYYYNDRPHAVRTAGNISLQYDLNGNMTQRAVSGGNTLDLTYNFDNKTDLIKKNGINHVQFTYDGNGQRVKKYNYATSQSVLYFGELYETRGGAATIHVFAGNQRVASVFLDGTTQFYHKNHLGSASVITDQNGARKEQIEYFPFGTYRAVGNINGTYDFDPTFPDVFYTFTGQEDDDDLGLYNYGARLYDPVLGRFISPDRLVQAPENPQTLNRYTYCLNNPLIYTDPSGEWIEWIIIGAVLGAISGGVQAYRSGGNIFQGILLGAFIGAVSAGVGVVVGGFVSSWATCALTWVIDTASPFYGAAVSVSGAVGGGFAGGATSGALNAAAYGGSAWKSALYGGLMSAAIAGTIAFAIELNNWANSGSQDAINIKNPKTGKLESIKPLTQGELERILRVTGETKLEAEGYLGRYGHVRIFSTFDFGGEMRQQIINACVPGSGCNRAFDLFAEAWKIDNLHIRAYTQSYGFEIRFHLDRVALTGSFGNFVKHFWFDMVINTYYAVKHLGSWPGLAEGL